MVVLYSSVSLYQQSHASVRKSSNDRVNYPAFRPSDHFTHLEYDLELFTDVATFTPGYWGSVLITVKCILETNKIFLDRVFLKINADTIQAWEYTEDKNDQTIPVLYGRNVSKEDGYKIKFKVYLQPNITYKVKLEFSYEILNTDPGFIYTYYRQNTDHPKVKGLVYTKMKNSLANHVFPCFNTAEMKAKFRIKIGHLENVNSFTPTKQISRKPIDNPKEWRLDSIRRQIIRSTFLEEKIDQTPDRRPIPKIWVMDEFAETSPIVIFSIALAVVDFISDEPVVQKVGPPDNLSAVEIRLWAERDILDLAKGVLRVVSQSLAFYSDIFEAPYNLGKLDLIVLPDKDITVEDNYGLIYLGEEVIINNILTESTDYQNGYTFVLEICQAVGRQWIGHLVTLSNQHENWFHDGLHSYLQANCSVEVFHNWELPVQLELIDSFITLLRIEELGRDFNRIHKLKSGSHGFSGSLNSETQLKVQIIVRMLSFIFEVEKNLFLKTLASYVREFRGAAASLTEVWNSLTLMSNSEKEIHIFPEGVNLEEIFISWLGQRGYPMITVSRNAAGNVITVTQEIFLFPNQNELSKNCWPIPFDVITKGLVLRKKERVRKWLKCSNSGLEITLAYGKENYWLVLSLQLHVPARIYYDQKGWSLIQELFHNKNEIENIDSLTRIQIINDMFTFAAASKLTYDFVFETIKYISHEKDGTCLNVIFEELKRIRSRWIGTSLFQPFQKFVRTIVKPIFQIKIQNIEQFLKSEQANNQLERNILITACTFELPDCKEYSEGVLFNWMMNAFQKPTNPIPDFLQKCLFCLEMINADVDKWNFLLKEYVKNPENSSILEALGCSRNIKILKKYLKWSLDVKNPHTSAKVGLNVFEILSSRSDQGYQLIRPFFKKNLVNSFNKYLRTLKKFVNKFKGEVTIDDFLIQALKGARNGDDLKMLLTFALTLENRKKEKVIDQDEARVIAKRNISWFSENANKVADYLSTSSNVGS